MATKTKEAPKDALDQWVERAKKDLTVAMAMMLWQNRFNQPDMYVQITEHDIEAFEQSMRYQKLTPTVIVHREPGTPATPGRPAAGNARAIPPSPGTPPKPYAVVLLVEKDKLGRPTMNGIKAIENNQEDYDRANEVQAIRRWRDKAPDLATALTNAARTGDYSSSDLMDAANALMALASAQR